MVEVHLGEDETETSVGLCRSINGELQDQDEKSIDIECQDEGLVAAIASELRERISQLADRAYEFALHGMPTGAVPVFTNQDRQRNVVYVCC
jgi:hypothetical protein